MSATTKGGCLCGNYSYQFDRETVVSCHHCHCTDCQKATGSGKATIIMVPINELKSEGELKTYTVTGSAGRTVTRAFCADCGSQVLSYVAEMPDLRFIKAGTLEDSSWVTIDSSFWTSSAQVWSPADPDVLAHDKNPTG